MSIGFHSTSLVFNQKAKAGTDCWKMQLKVGVEGAKEFGDFEEWFNYKLSRATSETCAKFLGNFVVDKTNSQFTKGGK